MPARLVPGRGLVADWAAAHTCLLLRRPVVGTDQIKLLLFMHCIIFVTITRMLRELEYPDRQFDMVLAKIWSR